MAEGSSLDITLLAERFGITPKAAEEALKPPVIVQSSRVYVGIGDETYDQAYKQPEDPDGLGWADTRQNNCPFP